MNERWKTAVLGGAIGAAISLAVVFTAVFTGVLPVATDGRIYNYLMAHPRLASTMQDMEAAQEAEAAQRTEQAAVDRLGTKPYFDPAVAYVTGPANARNTFVEFFDYNCGHCRNTYPAVQKFYEAHKGDTRFAFIDFPIFGDLSTSAARVSVAARDQGDRYLALHFALMSEGKAAIDSEILTQDVKKSGLNIPKLSADLTQPNVDKILEGALRLARESGFRGTPVFIINGKVHEGEITEAEIRQLMKS